MKLLKIQNKFIEGKPCKNSIVKGRSNTGKTEAFLHRILNLVNNFAFEKEDKILFVQKEKGLLDKIKSRFNKVKLDNNYKYISLLSSNVEPEFITLNELILRYSNGSILAKQNERLDILKEGIKIGCFKRCNKLNNDNLYLILNEIKYMKNNNIKKAEEFMTLMGGPLKLRKNSPSRAEMFILYSYYNRILKEKGLVDEEDRIRLAIENINKEDSGYVHLFIDNVEGLSKLELEFLLALYKDKSYGTITLGIDVDKGENIYSELVKKGRVYAKKVFGNNKKIYNFKVDVVEKNNKQVINEEFNIKEKYKFFDLKHRRNFDFSIENTGFEEKVLGELDEKYSDDELEQIPVFNNIAAGEPILISPEQQDTFTLPKYWVKGGNKKFILKVKGNSMIKANINDGDLVVIEQTQAPMNGDIVAVNIEGSATLKTLSLTKTTITLLPENDDYEPIVVTPDEEFYILGKAIGVIRK
ncbi:MULTISPECIES: transcriptional repressor LexA [Clostridium]|uniref:transcriptional repressor LexA n=1 Tax=Clostridium TaxID=1485 RepID=UPI0006670201|nr:MULTISPECIES: transcriptional repressor LexA [Clostridium]MDB2087551.1 transcriptional repressor LexA [Clostridium paraputrificum]MDB2107579.1 transcriptional repressor LexA [Clostridium paraputrificum]MDB2114501.1 transcriptional repressor LexA [Clostridium paraputrificum]MDB2120718.1 transcriptional repressor LexA [Clostridium paraputrificum]MDU1033730.1 transcriptional repressor LexA [Clostridium sp.]